MSINRGKNKIIEWEKKNLDHVRMTMRKIRHEENIPDEDIIEMIEIVQEYLNILFAHLDKNRIKKECD